MSMKHLQLSANDQVKKKKVLPNQFFLLSFGIVSYKAEQHKLDPFCLKGMERWMAQKQKGNSECSF